MVADKRIDRNFFIRDVLQVAPDILGKILVRDWGNGKLKRYTINEVEAYRGEEDLACHASKGRTKRNDVMYREGGMVYVYLIYGMYWMLNFVTGNINIPQAILIRGVEGFNGPGKVTKEMDIEGSFYGENLGVSTRIWIEDNGFAPEYIQTPRIGIEYAGDIWKTKPWRFIIK